MINKKFSFEKFTYKKLSSGSNPAVSILKQGSLGLNYACMEKYFQKKNFAILFYDRKNHCLGIQPVAEQSKESYKLRSARKGRYGFITAISFLKHYGIEHNQTKNYPCEWSDENKMIIIDLNESSK